MQYTATEFRKQLFPILERALNGEPVEVTYKGQAVRLAPVQPRSILDRMVPQDLIIGPDDAASFQRDSELLLKEMRAAWEADWDEAERKIRQLEAEQDGDDK